MKQIKKSFKNAFFGIVNSLKSEMNMRVHFSVANLIVIFAYFFGLSNIEWAILLLTIAMVIGAELMNTGIENAVDTATDEICEQARRAKDASAGAVLLCAIFSVVIGVMLFFDIDRIINTLSYIFLNPLVLVICLVIGILDVLYVIFGGEKNVGK